MEMHWKVAIEESDALSPRQEYGNKKSLAVIKAMARKLVVNARLAEAILDAQTDDKRRKIIDAMRQNIATMGELYERTNGLIKFNGGAQ